MSGGGDSPVIGFKYLFGIHMGISRGPVDELIEIKVGDKTAWRGLMTETGDTTISQPDLFGGTKGEGGIDGVFTFMAGDAAQVAHPNLASVLQSPMPGFRRRLTVFFNGMVTAMNPYPKPWAFRVRRARKGWDNDNCWYPEKAVVSLVRPVGPGEVAGGGTSETKTVDAVFSAIPTTSDVINGPWTMTVVPLGPSVTYGTVYVIIGDASSGYGDGGSGGNSFSHTLTEGVDYTRSGDVITLTHFPETEGSTSTGYNDVRVYVNYTYALTTFDPIGGIGDGLIQAMNPVHIVYEALTNPEWGRGFPRSLLDDTAWRYAADLAFAEGFGMCLMWKRTDSISSFIQSVLNHVGATLFDDRITGKIKIRLIRGDYLKSQVALFERDSGLLEIKEAMVGTNANMVNEVRVTYRDPVTNEDRVVRASNIAALRSSGGAINSLTKEYKGIPTPDLASRLAKRDLKAMSPLVRRFTVVLDRRGFNVTPGSLIRIQDLSRNISDTVLRVVSVDYGRLGDGKIAVQALQDVFALPSRGFTTIGPPTWQPPTKKPCVGDNVVFEMPYRMLYRKMSTADFNVIDPTSAYLGAVCQEGQPLNATFKLAIRSGAPETEDNAPDDSFVCPLVPVTPFVDLILQCHFDTDFTDSSPVGRTLTAAGGASISTVDPKNGAGSLLIASFGQRLTSPYSADLLLPGNFAIRCWVKTSTITGIIVCVATNNGDQAWRLTFGGGGHAYFQWYYDAGVSTGAISGTTGICDGTWHHIEVTRVGDEFKLFVDGVNEGPTVTQAGVIGGAGPTPVLAIGSYPDFFSALTGRVDDIEIELS